jgi:phage shock protein A
MSRLFRADVNAVLDRMEAPEILLKQAIREMQEALAKDERQLKLIDMNIKQLNLRHADMQRRLKPVTEELDLCFESGNEGLARNLLKRKLESERYLDYLERRQREFSEAFKALDKLINQNRLRLESMQQKAELLVESNCEETPLDAWNELDSTQHFAVSDDDIELALLREKQRRAQS